MQEQQASREILFHGKNRTTKQWVEGYYLKRGEATLIYDVVQQGCGHFVDPQTVGQYVNRTDKNGRKIFEGDVLKYFQRFPEEDLEDVMAVYFEECICGFMLKHRKPNEIPDLPTDLPSQSEMKYFEVIGNVYDNPELLEVAR